MNKNSIKEAAKLAGVSVASISRALNGKPGISEKTRQRIVDICNQLGYQPSDAARRLKIGKSSHIGLCMGRVDKQHSHYIYNLYDKLNQKLIDSGFVLSLYTHDKIDSLIKETGGAILTGIEEGDQRISSLKNSKVPFVTIGKSANNFWVCPDDELGGRLAAEHLLSLGCTRNIVIENVVEGKGTKARSIGFQTYLQEKGLMSSNLYIKELHAIELQAYRTVTSMLKQGGYNFDAAFCENDDIAYGALMACEDFGLKVPEQFKIVGFDDLPDVFSEITTVRQDIRQIANSAIELLEEAKKNMPVRQVLLPVELIKRNSTKS